MPLKNEELPDLTQSQAKQEEQKPNDNNLNQNSVEFAEKKPLFTTKTMIKAGLIVVAVFITGVLIISLVAVLKKRPKDERIEPPKPEQPQIATKPITKDLPKIVYIKNKNSIWETDIQGTHKLNLIKLESNSPEYISSVNWKTKDTITYSLCTTNGSGCSLIEYNIQNKSHQTILTNNKTTSILRHVWSPDKKTLAYIEVRGGNIYLNLKNGNITTPLESSPYIKDPGNTKNRVLFTPNNEYVIYYIQKQEQVINTKNPREIVTNEPYPTIVAYRLNGIKVDEIKNASDPFLIDTNLVGYIKDGALKYKSIGDSTETLITNQTGLNPVISPNKKLIAFWAKETNGIKRITLQIFDTNLNIRRDILRSIALPTWLTDHSLAGIKTDSCLTENCLLYEFQTVGLVIVDIDTSKTTVVDQGDSISQITLDTNAD